MPGRNIFAHNVVVYLRFFWPQRDTLRKKFRETSHVFLFFNKVKKSPISVVRTHRRPYFFGKFGQFPKRQRHFREDRTVIKRMPPCWISTAHVTKQGRFRKSGIKWEFCCAHPPTTVLFGKFGKLRKRQRNLRDDRTDIQRMPPCWISTLGGQKGGSSLKRPNQEYGGVENI